MKKGKQLLAWANFPIAHFARSIDINSCHQNSYNFYNSFDTREPFIAEACELKKSFFLHVHAHKNDRSQLILSDNLFKEADLRSALYTNVFH